MSIGETQKTYFLSIKTSDGSFVAGYSDKGLASLQFPSGKKENEYMGKLADVPKCVQEWHGLATRAVMELLKGKEPKSVPPLDFSCGTHFQQSVWQALCEIRFGRTSTYGQVAEAIGKPKAVRAVGGACGANPIPVLVPCHRVLASNDRLGGFSAGLEWKKILLQREGAQWFA